MFASSSGEEAEMESGEEAGMPIYCRWYGKRTIEGRRRKRRGKRAIKLENVTRWGLEAVLAAGEDAGLCNVRREPCQSVRVI